MARKFIYKDYDMESVSGQNNAYQFDLHNSLGLSLLDHIWIHTDRKQIAGNYITLSIHRSLQVKAALDSVNKYVTERLQNLGALLITQLMPPWADDVLAGKAVVNDEVPTYIKVSNYVDARKVIDDLFAHNEMSAGVRSEIEEALRELEKSAQFASNRAESISIAQKEVILDLISPYVDHIKSKAPNNIMAKSWICAVANALITFGPSIRTNLPWVLWSACKSGHKKNNDFYESLFALAKIYSSMGDLESPLKQLGESLPSQVLIQKMILDLFD